MSWSVEYCNGCLMRKTCHFKGCIYDDLDALNLRGVLSERDKIIILLLGANNNTPIPSMTHLIAELFLIEQVIGYKVPPPNEAIPT